MALEDSLDRLAATLAQQNESNRALVQTLQENQSHTYHRDAQLLEAMRELVELSRRNQDSLGSQVSRLVGEIAGQQQLLLSAANSTGTASAGTLDALRSLAEQSSKLEEASRTFGRAATQTQQNSSELAQLIELMRVQTKQQSLGIEQQTLSLKYQNEAIQTTLRLAKEDSRSSWAQNWLFFFLGVLIPVVAQLVFKLV